MIWAVMLFFGVAAVVILFRKRTDIRLWKAQEQINRVYLRCFLTSGGMIVFTVLMIIMMVISLYAMIAPM